MRAAQTIAVVIMLVISTGCGKKATTSSTIIVNDANFQSIAATTDAGLEHLNGLTKLRSLRLNDTNVTIEGVKKLKRALPNCVITRVLYDIP